MSIDRRRTLFFAFSSTPLSRSNDTIFFLRSTYQRRASVLCSERFVIELHGSEQQSCDDAPCLSHGEIDGLAHPCCAPSRMAIQMQTASATKPTMPPTAAPMTARDTPAARGATLGLLRGGSGCCPPLSTTTGPTLVTLMLATSSASEKTDARVCAGNKNSCVCTCSAMLKSDVVTVMATL